MHEVGVHSRVYAAQLIYVKINNEDMGVCIMCNVYVDK
jgi:hypothetical protein